MSILDFVAVPVIVLDLISFKFFFVILIFLSLAGDSAYGELYASLDVPEGHNIYGPANAQEPFYNVLQGPSSGNEEDGQNYGTIRLEQPMYNVLEDLSGMGPGKDEEGGPNRVEPVYNVLEETYPGNAERSQHYGAISVNDPFYNTLEETQGKSGPQGTNDEPVYNTLEEPYPSGAAEDDSYGPRGVQDPVYNVLEGPGTDKIDSNTPTYAVVNKKRWEKKRYRYVKNPRIVRITLKDGDEEVG